MTLYPNGEIPNSVVSVVLASGIDSNGYWEFRATPATAARWNAAKADAVRTYGRPIFIRTGWNIYRPLAIQVAARRRACDAGNCNGAATPGYSSHGGNWGGRGCLAIDVDPNGLTWDQVDVVMTRNGFAARLITAQMSGFYPDGERWHYIDFAAFGPAPAGSGSTSMEWDEMADRNDVKQAAKEALDELLIERKLGPGQNGRNFWDSLKFIADLAAAAHPSKMWAFPVQAQDGEGNPIFVDGKPVMFPARGYIASTAGRLGAIDAGDDVDEEAIAASIVASIADLLPTLPADLVEKIAEASADEYDRRERERLGLDV